MRRTLIVTAVVILVLGAGVFVYFYFFAGPSVTTTPGLPISGPGAPQPGGTIGGVPITPSGPTSIGARLVRISIGPVVLGEAVTSRTTSVGTSSPTTSETTVSYIERQSGNVYSYSSSSHTITRTSNKTIPGIQSASWLPNASVAFVRYLSGADFSTINTYALPANGVGGFFMAQNLSGIAVSSTSVLMLASGGNGSIGSLTNVDGTHPSQIFTTPLSSIRVSFSGKNQYLVYTKSSSQIPGDAFIVDSAGHFSRIAGPQVGLVALASPQGKWVLTSYTAGGTMQMQLVNTTTNEILPLPIATIADKCVWAADDSAIYCGIPMDPPVGVAYPDDWYQGALQFSDRIWKIQVSGRYAQLVLDFTKETSGSLDAEALAVDPSNTTLVFVNKNDGSLWSYSL
ncbi:MAG: hypothetical protein Q8L52_02100 [bacterium]|nr:hypothetical protein [bacterium]